MHMSISFLHLHAYSPDSRGSDALGADRPGAGRGAGRAAAAPGGPAVPGATAGVRLRPGGRVRADH